ncbi:MAG: hypothetical protein O7C98_10590 [Planctomycetota bacterium]|nr:hypothetical protein [Planctomycetota bacterium]
MKGRGPALLSAAVLLLAGAAGAVLATSSRLPAREARSGAFQQLVGGLGLGPQLDLSRCAAAFDARLGPPCSLRHEPVLCGSWFCPVHAGPPSLLIDR